MNEQQILSELTGIFHQIFDDENIMLKPDTVADDIEEWDSFNHVSLIVAVESHFKIKFQSAEVEELRNVGDFVKAISEKTTIKA